MINRNNKLLHYITLIILKLYTRLTIKSSYKAKFIVMYIDVFEILSS